MPTDHILALLIVERDKLNRAIEALQGPMKRIGRPPKNPVAIASPTVTPEPAGPAPAKRGRRFSAAQRKKQAESMKAYWAAKKSEAPSAETPKPVKRKLSAAHKRAIRAGIQRRLAEKKAATAKVAKNAVSASKKTAAGKLAEIVQP